MSRSYIAQTIFMAPLDSRFWRTGLCRRMLVMVSSTFFRAAAFTKALFFEEPCGRRHLQILQPGEDLWRQTDR